MTSNKLRQLFATSLKRLLAKIRAAERQDLEDDYYCASTACPAPERANVTAAVRAQDAHFAVDQRRSNGKARNSTRDLYKVFGKIRGLTRPEPHMLPLLKGKHPVTVVVRVITPGRATRRHGS